MKTFIIINGADIKATEQKSIGYAREVAIAISDHSKEIIVREVTGITPQALDLLINNLIDPLTKKERKPCCWNM